MKHPDIGHMVHFHLNLYYDIIQKDPRIRTNPTLHIEEIKKIDTIYKECLSNRYNKHQFDYEENKDKFVDKIDELTQVFTNEEIKKAKSEEIKKMTAKWLSDKPAEEEARADSGWQ